MAQIDKSNLIVLPEMFTSGFTMQAKQVADVVDGEVLQWMQSMAFKKEAVIIGSVVIEEEGNFYNRLLWVNPDGTFAHYNKRHFV